MYKYIRIKTLYIRMLLTYLPMVAAILIGTASAIILVTGSYISRVLDEMRLAELYTATDVMDEKIINLYDALYQLAVNESVVDYGKSDLVNVTYDDIMTIKRVGDAFDNTVANNDLIREVFLYQTDTGNIFSSQYRGEGLYNPVNNEWNFYCDYFEGVTRDDVRTALESVKRRCFLILPNRDDMSLLLATPIPMVSDHPGMILSIIVNFNEFSRLSTVLLDENENLLVVSENDRILCSFNKSYPGLLAAETGVPDYGQDGYMLYEKASVHAGLTYYYLTDPAFLQKHTNTVALYGVLISSGALLLISTLILLLSRNIYRPVQSILSMLPRSALSAEPITDMELIKKNLSGLQQEDTRLRSHILSARPYVIEQVLYKLLHDDIPAHKARKIMEEMSITFDRESVTVCIIKICDYAVMIRQFPEAVITGIKEQISIDIVAGLHVMGDVYMVSEGSVFYGIIHHDMKPENFEHQMVYKLQDIQQHLLLQYEIKTKMVIGTTPSVSVAGNTESLMDALQESLAAAEESMEALFFANDQQIIRTSSTPAKTSRNIYLFSPEDKQELSSRLFMGRSEEAIDMVSEIIATNREVSCCHWANMKQLLSDLLSVAIQILLDSHTPLDRVLKPRNQLLVECEACESLGDATAYIRDVYRTVGNYFAAFDAQWPVRKEDVLAYIRSNLDRDVSIGDIADHFSLSKGYYCKIFKEMTGSTTLEYMSQCRIEKAHELIREGRHSLKNIADKVGLSNYKTFIRLFKKHTGCTPGEYKSKIASIAH